MLKSAWIPKYHLYQELHNLCFSTRLSMWLGSRNFVSLYPAIHPLFWSALRLAGGKISPVLAFGISGRRSLLLARVCWMLNREFVVVDGAVVCSVLQLLFWTWGENLWIWLWKGFAFSVSVVPVCMCPPPSSPGAGISLAEIHPPVWLFPAFLLASVFSTATFVSLSSDCNYCVQRSKDRGN